LVFDAEASLRTGHSWQELHHNLWYDEIKANGTLEYKD